MTPLDWTLWGCVGFLALVAGKLSLPKPPELNWKDFFALCVVTPIRGELDAEGGKFEDWLARCEPLTGRGEMDYVYEDPADFGEGYSLETSLGMGADWELLASDSGEIRSRLLQRNPEIHWVIRGCDWAESLSGWIQHCHFMDGPKETLMDELGELLSDLSRRVIFVGEGIAAQEWTELLHAEAGLRDRTLAVLGINAELNTEWMDANFNHVTMDTELERKTAFFHLGFESDGNQKGWPQPPEPDSQRVSVYAEELGPILVERSSEEDHRWAQALVLTMTHWVAIES